MGVIESRRSIRKFTGEPIEKEVIIKIAKAGMHAACAYGDRPWEFIIITKKDVIQQVAEVNLNCVPARNAAALIIPLYVPKKQRKQSDWWMEDMSACTQNILLKITEEGLGGVWLGIYPRQDRVDYLREHLSIPKEVIPFAIIAVGHPAETGKINNREDAKIHFERY